MKDNIYVTNKNNNKMKLIKLLGEEDVVYKVLSDNGDRVLVEPLHFKFAIKPTEVVNKKFITQIIE